MKDEAKKALLKKLRRILGREHLDAVHVDLVNALLGPDCIVELLDALLEVVQNDEEKEMAADWAAYKSLNFKERN